MIDFATEIMKNPKYQSIMAEIEQLEADRIYCKHGMAHVMDVCRLAWILYLEDTAAEETPFSVKNAAEVRQRIYVVGLLHDIGRAIQYKEGIHHAEAGAQIAGELLEQIQYPSQWRTEALDIIRDHCGNHGCEEKGIRNYINRADHLSRSCFCCKAADTCKWTMEERNKVLQ